MAKINNLIKERDIKVNNSITVYDVIVDEEATKSKDFIDQIVRDTNKFIEELSNTWTKEEQEDEDRYFCFIVKLPDQYKDFKAYEQKALQLTFEFGALQIINYWFTNEDVSDKEIISNVNQRIKQTIKEFNEYTNRLEESMLGGK